MKKLYILLLILPLFGTSQNKNYISIGFLDHKTGSSAIGYTRSILQNANNEVFVGFGTMIMMTHFGIGWKRYYETGKKLKPFSCISMFERGTNKLGTTNGSSIREDSCYGFSGGASLMLWDRKEKRRDLYLNIGAIAVYDFRNEIMGYPFINIEFK